MAMNTGARYTISSTDPTGAPVERGEQQGPVHREHDPAGHDAHELVPPDRSTAHAGADPPPTPQGHRTDRASPEGDDDRRQRDPTDDRPHRPPADGDGGCRRLVRPPTPRGSARSTTGGTSRAGLRSKNPTGVSRNPVYSTGMTGQSSGRGRWVTPNVYQSTTSASTSVAVGRRPLGQPGAAGVLVGVVAGGPPLRRARRA